MYPRLQQQPPLLSLLMLYLPQATTGVVSGVGKGLAGVVTKPIGGAAEFLAQTGSGLLQGSPLALCDCVCKLLCL